MRRRPIAFCGALTLLTHVGCSTERFTGRGTGSEDAGAAGIASVPEGSGGSDSNGEGGAPNAGNDAGAGNGTSGAGNGTSGAGSVSSGGESGATSEPSGDGGSGAMSTGAGGTESAAGATGDAGYGGESVGPECDPNWSPAEHECVVHEAYGVFVAPSGSDERGNGSREEPFGTIARAIASAVATGRRVYVCADGGDYAESVNVDVVEGLSLYGGFSCADWSYATSRKSVVSSRRTRALHVSSAARVRFEDFRFEAADATLAGESSMAAWVVESKQVVFERSVIQAGSGANGAHGGIAPFSFPAASTLRGNAATGGEDGSLAAAKHCTCQSEEFASTGGAGGPPGNLAGTAGLPALGGGQPGRDGADTCGIEGPTNGKGKPGADGVTPKPSPGATSHGFVNLQGWHPTAGQPGNPGIPGQGGGGGASLVVSPAALRGTVSRGGGGGCGGCGGNGGGAGRGGGASIALFVLSADVTLSQTELIASDGGDGGAGHPGQEGQQQFGYGGRGADACSGGQGGKGARGGAGGGGAGGLSVGVLLNTDSTLTQVDAAIRTGAAGPGGLGGDAGINDGIDGVARDVYELM